MGGMVVETNQTEILTHIEAQQRIEKQEAGNKLVPLEVVVNLLTNLL